MAAPDELWRLSAAELSDGYQRARLDPVEVLDAVLARIDSINGPLNAIVTLDADGARAQAQASAARWRNGTARSALDGVPISIKDNLHVRGLRTTWGSRLYADFVASADELPVARIRDAGMVILGKTNVPEFTLTGYTDNELFGVTRNPWNLDLTPGGSSGGAVAAVASGMGPLALGTDGGGSARRPASHTHLVGLKPSRGRVARADGLPAILFDFEVVAPIARTSFDVELLMRVIALPHARDPASAPFATHPWSMPAARGHRILYVPRFGDAPVDPRIEASVAAAVRMFADAGHVVEEGAVPFDAEAFNAVWPIVSQAGLATLLARASQWRNRVGAAFVEIAEAGMRLPATALVEALWEVARMREKLGEALARHDVLLTPATAALPWPARESFPSRIAGRDVGPRGHAVYAAFVNASGCAGISIPCAPSDEGVPIGLQLVAAPGGDETLCALALEHEARTGWSARWPALRGAIR
jgi:aspartyl-tRNA(Asn)/glutamyl-tRNA(Gln) amidotransferase subunit A